MKASHALFIASFLGMGLLAFASSSPYWPLVPAIGIALSLVLICADFSESSERRFRQPIGYEATEPML